MTRRERGRDLLQIRLGVADRGPGLHLHDDGFRGRAGHGVRVRTSVPCWVAPPTGLVDNFSNGTISPMRPLYSAAVRNSPKSPFLAVEPGGARCGATRGLRVAHAHLRRDVRRGEREAEGGDDSRSLHGEPPGPDPDSPVARPCRSAAERPEVRTRSRRRRSPSPLCRGGTGRSIVRLPAEGVRRRVATLDAPARDLTLES